MAFEKGNKLGGGVGAKVFDAALRRAISQDNGKRLRDAAESLLTEAANGQPWALSMLADRLDGKAAQSVDVTHTHKKVTEYTDAELVAIAFGSSAGDAESQASAGQPPGVH